MSRHYTIWYRIEDGTSYEVRSKKVSTIMGVASAFQDLHERGYAIQSWERVTTEPPTEEEVEALKAFLAMAGVPYGL